MNVSVSLMKSLSFAAARTRLTTLLWQDLKPSVFHSLSSSWPLWTFLHLPHSVWWTEGAQFKKAPKHFCFLLPEWEQVVTWVENSSVFWKVFFEWSPKVEIIDFENVEIFNLSLNLQTVSFRSLLLPVWMWWSWAHCRTCEILGWGLLVELTCQHWGAFIRY